MSIGLDRGPGQQFAGITAMEDATLQDGRFSVRLDGGRFECYLHQRPGRFLFVLLSGARDPEKHPLPKFERWSWTEQFPGSILCICDPALYLNGGTLRIGWYAGTDKHNWPLRMSGLVSLVARKLGKDSSEVISYGSSAGGFASLMLAARLGNATAIAINPQTDVLRYSKRFVGDFLQACFSGREQTDLSAAERARLTVAPAMLRAPNAKYVIVQNTQDRHHYEHHYKPFCRLLGAPMEGGPSSDGRGVTMLYSHPDGHGREPRDLVGTIVRTGVDLANNTTSRRLQSHAASAPTLIALTRSDHASTSPSRMRASQLYLLASKFEPSGDASITFRPPGRSDVKPYSLALPIDWDIDPYEDRNWRAQLHMWRMIDSHLLEFDRTEDPKWLALPIRFIDDWHRFHVREGRPSSFSWMDMIVGVRSMKLAFVLSAHHAGKIALSATQLEAYSTLVKLHLEFLLNPELLTYSNHTFLDMHGLAALRSVISDQQQCAQIDAFLDKVIPKLIASQFNDEAVHLENSTGYQIFGIGCIKRLQKSGWFDRFDLEALIRKANAVNDWFKLPDGRTVPIGDTDGAPMPAVAASVFSGRNQLFNSSGYVIYRDDGGRQVDRASYLFFMGAFNSRFHKQADDLSFVWFEGEDILCDAGKFAYKASEMRGYVQSTRAHNTVEIDDKSFGESFSAMPHLAYGSAVKSAKLTPWGLAITGEVSHRKVGVKHKRHLFYARGHWLLLVDAVVSLEAGRPHKLTRWLHFSPHLQLQSNGVDRYQADLTSGRRLDILTRGSGKVSSCLIHGQVKPVRQGWLSQAYGKLTPNFALGHTQENSEHAIFATLLTLDSTGSELDLSVDGLILFTLKTSSGSDEYFTIDAEEGTCEPRGNYSSARHLL